MVTPGGGSKNGSPTKTPVKPTSKSTPLSGSAQAARRYNVEEFSEAMTKLAEHRQSLVRDEGEQQSQGLANAIATGVSTALAASNQNFLAQMQQQQQALTTTIQQGNAQLTGALSALMSALANQANNNNNNRK
jgi:flagellar biosynthesis/type III secretory pathway protein FliH